MEEGMRMASDESLELTELLFRQFKVIPPAVSRLMVRHRLDQFGLSSGREERLSLDETWGFHEPVRHRNDETARCVS